MIRYGLAAVKGVGEAAVEAMLAAREDSGAFSSLPDLCNRVDLRAVNRKVLEALIKAGACDSFGQSRASLTAQIDRSLSRAASAAADRARGQETLFGMLETNDPEEEEIPAGLRNLPEWPDAEKLAYEKELLGFYVSGHPLEPFLGLVDSYCTHQVGELKELPGRTIVRVAGLVSEVRRGISRKTDKPYCIATVEDLETEFGVLCVNENYDKFNHLPQEIFPIDEAPRRFTKQVHLRLKVESLQPASMDGVRELAEAHPGSIPLLLCLRQPSGESVFVEANDNFNVAPSRDFQSAANERFGADTYYAKVDMALPEPKRRFKRRESNSDDE